MNPIYMPGYDTLETSRSKIRTRLALGEVERLITKYNIVIPCPSRQTLIRMCEDGTFETPSNRRRSFWTVYEDSFWSWAYDEKPNATEKK